MILSEMFSFKLIYFTLFLTFRTNLGTIVKDNYPSRINVFDQDIDNEVINIKSKSKEKNSKEDDWPLRYFPEKVHHHHSIFSDRNDMYSVEPTCDDGQLNITLDLGNLAISTVCFTRKLLPDVTIPPIIHEDVMPHAYDPPHICMEKSIEYTDPMISYGAHRPLWGEYGEYEFIPKQRWLHNLEHGAVVMLYHPCAHPLVVDQLRKLVKSCLRRYIITPYNLLPPERPLAVYTWGKYLNMNVVDPELVIDFIKKNAFRGPEDIADDGKYNNLLISKSEGAAHDDMIRCYRRD